jgi:cobalt-zinc-cadmium efflux system protein
MSHYHDHSSKNLKTAFFLNLFFTVIELIAGLYVNSIAIISDAVHDLGDSLSLGLAWLLDVKSKKPKSDNFSFGYRRFSLLGALINSIILITGSIFVINAAAGRILEPQTSDAKGMLFFAILGVLVNGYAAWKTSSGKTINEKVVTWHLLEDVLGWVAILIGSIIMLFTDNLYIDPVLSLLITLFILWNVIKRLKETLYIFLQGNPENVNKDEIEKEILQIPHVQSLHHTHIWSMDGEHHVFTTHVKLGPIENIEGLCKVKNQIKAIVQKYPFEHYTIETETDLEKCEFEEQ